MNIVLENLKKVAEERYTISIAELVEILEINSFLPIISWVKEGKLQLIKPLDGTSEILQESIVLVGSVAKFIRSQDDALIQARNRKKELDTLSLFPLDESEVNEK